MNPHTRVVVSGMGVVAPNGIGLEAYWDSLVHCKSGVGPITLFDTSDIPLKIAAEIKNFDLREFLGNGLKPKRMARQTQLGLVACDMAIKHSGISLEWIRRSAPLSLVIGICSAAVDVIEKGKELTMTRGFKRLPPHFVGACQPHAIGAALVQMLGVQTSVTTISSACPSGLDAVTAATRMIKEGRADFVVVGSADSPLNLSTVASFCAAGIPSISADFPPGEISRPFDSKRSGAVLAEGAAFLILERLDSALARGAEPYMEISGGATYTDTPGSEGMEGLFQSMNAAMVNAGIYPEQVDYICANAVSDPKGDRIETEWIKQCFGNRAYHVPVSSIRGVMGHPLAPAGLFQLIACALSFKNQTIIPTANLCYPDPECDLDYVPRIPRRASLDIILANGHGMGGENSTVVIKRIQ